MSETKFDLLLHPVRMQIIHALLGEKGMSAQALGERLTDVPAATLYRHLNLLVEGGVLMMTGEPRTRGPAGRVFTMAEERLVITPDELAQADAADHMRYFTTFAAGLISSFARYLKRPKIDIRGDGVGYRQHVLNLTDEELTTLIADLDARMHQDAANPPGAGRTPRVLTRIVLPDDHPVEEG